MTPGVAKSGTSLGLGELFYSVLLQTNTLLTATPWIVIDVSCFTCIKATVKQGPCPLPDCCYRLVDLCRVIAVMRGAFRRLWDRSCPCC
jgi:hypothetical protein